MISAAPLAGNGMTTLMVRDVCDETPLAESTSRPMARAAIALLNSLIFLQNNWTRFDNTGRDTRVPKNAASSTCATSIAIGATPCRGPVLNKDSSAQRTVIQDLKLRGAHSLTFTSGY